MNPVELIHFIEELIRSETKVIAFSVVSILVTLFAVYALRHWVFPKKDSEKELAAKELEIARRGEDIARKDEKIGSLERKLEDRERKTANVQQQLESAEQQYQREKSSLQERLGELSKSCEDLKDENVELGMKVETNRQLLEQSKKDADLLHRKAVTVVTKYKKEVASLTDQMKQIERQEGRFWESPIRTTIPSFRPLDSKSATIIAITNLKGGVGKTSLTANIAATLWQTGKRVLVVDLDHQTSLTTLCLTIEQINDLRPGAGKFVNNVLKSAGNHASVAWDNMTRINDDGAYILPASKELAEVEEHVKASWLLNPTGFDARYVLRAALHDRVIQDRFDFILLDSPPRPSTCLINALACCDYALIPALLDRTSTETVPYLIAWLRKLQEKGICPNLEILGVIANRTFPRKKLISREKGVWEDLEGKCSLEWSSPVHLFDRFVPNSTQFADAAATKTFAAFHPNLEPIFTKLVNELLERKGCHERSRVTTAS